jgi:hypothetical protein
MAYDASWADAGVADELTIWEAQLSSTDLPFFMMSN